MQHFKAKGNVLDDVAVTDVAAATGAAHGGSTPASNTDEVELEEKNSLRRLSLGRKKQLHTFFFSLVHMYERK